MGNKERRGARRDRSRNISSRVPELGYYLIITDTRETEKNYFDGLRKTIPENLKNRLVIKVEKSCTVDLIKKCKEILSKEPQYRIPWIVLDRDQVECFDRIIDDAENNGIKVGWSNPCIEIWFYSYFGIMPLYIESTVCCEKFKDKFQAVTKNVYQKSDNEIYYKLNKFGNEESALKIAELKHRL